MKTRAELMIAVAELIRARRLTQLPPQSCSVSQPRVSDLICGEDSSASTRW
jgi:predicted XRE-type DNA-binding protein